jgi:hypothetical protein
VAGAILGVFNLDREAAGLLISPLLIVTRACSTSS